MAPAVADVTRPVHGVADCLDGREEPLVAEQLLPLEDLVRRHREPQPPRARRLRGPAARTHSICWLAISMMWPVPITVDAISSAAGDEAKAKPAQAIVKMPAPSQVVCAS